MSNICQRCLYHELCFDYRYSNVKTKYMKKVNRKKNKDGETVIYVEKCNKFVSRKFKIKKTKKINKPIDKQ